MSDLKNYENGRIWKVRAERLVTVHGSASDDKPDMYLTRMDRRLYQAFISNWKAGKQVDFDIAHFETGVVGPVQNLYIDGNNLKFRGTVGGSPLADRMAETLRDPAKRANVRLSISFVPKDYYIDKGSHGLVVYTDGILRRIAFTTIPANPRSRLISVEMRAHSAYEDAAAMVGNFWASYLTEQESKSRG